MCRNIESLCGIPGTSIGQLYFKNKLIEKEIRFVVIRGREWEKEKLEEGD